MRNLVKTSNGFLPEVSSLFDDFFSKDWFNLPVSGMSRSNTVPAVNVKETDNTFELEVAAPGMSKKDFKVELDNDTLIISAEKENKVDESDKDGEYARREFSYQAFRRTFSVPETVVEGNKISAKYTDGILFVTLPKTDKAKVKPAREIKIS